MKLSLMTLGDQIKDPVTGDLQSSTQRHQSIVESSVLAEQAGWYGVNIGEHHGLEYTTSAPPVILAAIGGQTSTLKLGTAVTLLANLDPIRAAEDYATLDAISHGRCELVAGRGNFFVSTYTLFGQKIEDSRELFDNAVELLVDLWKGKTVNWTGINRPPVEDFVLQPAPVTADKPPLWIGGGASPETAQLAARLGLNLMLPSAFGAPSMFTSVVENYKEAWDAAGHDFAPQIGACWHVNVAETSQVARERWEPRYREYHRVMGEIIRRVNPNPPPFIDKPFDFEWLSTKGPAIVGSPDEVADRLGTLSEMLDVDVNLAYIDMGGLPAGELKDMVELIGGKVLPNFS